MEQDYIRTALRANDYPDWILQVPVKQPRQLSAAESTAKAKQSVCLPYVKGLSEKRAIIFHNHGVSTYHKPINTIRSLLVHPKDKVPDDNKCGVVYKFTCATCKDTFVGETGRSLGQGSQLCNKTPLTAVGEHRQQFHHNMETSAVKVLAREHLWSRKIRESIENRTKQQS